MVSYRDIWTGSVLLLALITLGSLQQPYDDFSDIYGPYCEKTGCCNDRKDECSQPIIGTLCYCDEFCNRTNVHDCCPDYWYYCKGLNIKPTTPIPTTPRPPPVFPPEEIKTCTTPKGEVVAVNKTIRDNCNNCRCLVIDRVANLSCDKNICLIDDPIILSKVRYEYHGWSASNYSRFWGRTLDEGIKLRLGTLQPQKDVTRMNPVKRYYDPLSLPRQFESSERWPRYITAIQDQGWCGSSWAVSTAAVASDRYGIISNGKEAVRLSSENLLSCLPKTLGCSGGRLDRAWTFVKKYGVVDDNCFPYVGSNNIKCTIGRIGSLRSVGCQPPQYSERTGRYKVGPAYRLGNETDIMFEILRSGPVQATMKVYHDFFSYTDGVYRYTGLSLSRLYGYHSVRIVGWGEAPTYSGITKYWKVANSWGEYWGEDGYFRILRGVNECDIESFVLGVWPRVDRQILVSNGWANSG